MSDKSRKIIPAALSALLIISSHKTMIFADSNIGDRRDPFYIEGAKYEKNFLVDIPNEYINLYNGELTLSQTDLYLPGNGSLDLKIQRNYSSRLWVYEFDKCTGEPRIPYGISEMSCVGFGWSLHMGRVENAGGNGLQGNYGDSLPVVVMPDGSRHPLYKDRNNSNQLISKELWIYKNVSQGKWELILTNGVKYTFEYKASANPAGYKRIIRSNCNWIEDPDIYSMIIAQAVEISDTHGNKITIQYRMPGSFITQSAFLTIPRIEGIKDSCGRQIDFIYYEGNEAAIAGLPEGLLKSIKYDTVEFRYSYISNGLYNLLKKVRPPAGKEWRYEYYGDSDLNRTIPGTDGVDLLLKTITYPTGADITYEFQSQLFSVGKIKQDNLQEPYSYYTDFSKAVKKKTISGRGLTDEVFDYTYTPSYSKTLFPAGDSIYDSTAIDYPEGKKEKYYFYGWGATKPAKAIIDAQEWQFCDTLWRLGQLIRKEVIEKDGDVLLEEKYEYEKSKKPISPDKSPEYAGSVVQPAGVFYPLTIQKEITLGGKAYTVSYPYDSYDNYGNPRMVVETGNLNEWDRIRQRINSLEYENNPQTNILGKIKSKKIGLAGENFESSYTYNAYGDMVSATEYGITAGYDYDAAGNIVKETNARNYSTVSKNYIYGKPQLIGYGADSQGQNPLYLVTQEINPAGTIKSVTNGLGYKMSYEYDALNRLIRISPPYNVENDTIINYADDGSYKEVRKGKDFWIRYRYDGLGRYSGSENVIGVKTSIIYDTAGNKKFGSYPYIDKEIGEFYLYDALGRITEIRKPVDSNGSQLVAMPFDTIKYRYEANNSVKVTNERGKNIVYFYESFGNPNEKMLVTVIDQNNRRTRYSYNALGSLVSIIPFEDEFGAAFERKYTYNSSNLLAEEVTAERGNIKYTYDAAGNLKTKQDAKGVVSFDYDELNRLIKIDYPDYPQGNISDAAYVYDDADNKIREANGAGIFEYTYNQLNKITAKKARLNGKDYTTSYKYNKDGFLSGMIYPAGRTVDYAYDKANRIISLKPYLNAISYHPSGKIQKMRFPNGKETVYVYDDLYRVAKISTPGVIDLSYEYDGRSNVTKIEIEDGIGQQRLDFDYDNLDRITAGFGNWKVGKNTYRSLSYSYDAFGNRKSKLINEGVYTRYSYNDNNRLEAENGKTSKDFQYDPTGNLERNGPDKYVLSSTNKIANAAGLNMYYAPNNTKCFEGVSFGVSIYHYDENGNLISETDELGNFKKDYVYLQNMPIARITPELCDLAVYSKDINFSKNPVYLAIDTQVKIKALIRDIGAVKNDKNTKVSFYDGGLNKLIGSIVIPWKKRDSSLAEFDWNIINEKKGVHQIYVYVDPDKTIQETDKKNNIAGNFLFIDPTFIRVNNKDMNAFNEFMKSNASEN